MCVAAFACISVACAHNDDKKISYDQLPAAAKEFVVSHFANVKVKKITMDTDDQDYEVRLANGAEVNFRSNGEWKNVEARKGVPSSCVPAAILSYVNSSYAGKAIVKIERESQGGYEIQLSGMSEVELKFDAEGNFLRKDS